MTLPALRSFAEGRWQDGTGESRTLLDAATGEIVATLPTHGPDPAAVLGYARAVGGPALRALTFIERAAILKALARYLPGHLDEFVELSTRTGATRRDTAVDVDGGIGTLAVYASKATRELPDATILPDGATEPLGKGGTFAGRHIYTPKRGAAVQINAFNFPVWGMLEKFAPAFLAGMPSVVKPASQTAYLTELVVRRIIDSGLLPDGTLSMLCGSPDGLLDALTGQDTVGFTGSAVTAFALRTHPVVAGRSVAFNAEADSLNCAILGPDVTMDDLEFTLYVEQLVTEMTVKAGQKCTAIRRAFVPDRLAEAVTDAVCTRLSAVVVGHPALTETEMGPVASRGQRDEVRAAIARLATGAKVVFGDPQRIDVAGADAEIGAFLAPILLRGDDIHAASPHEVEAFGPVATVLPYADLDTLAGAVALGGGSLAGSIVTHDPAVARRLVKELGPWHGRLLVLDRDNAGESTGHGTAMPQMLHGGPGRAGGGEELGGLRALSHYMQRTAIQGHPEFLAGLHPTDVP
jgi:oxepin-CoA hydrolase/3-oxo-5,6-dehydrosuberyl-CoA semialdehyde dehydrogenase